VEAETATPPVSPRREPARSAAGPTPARKPAPERPAEPRPPTVWERLGPAFAENLGFGLAGAGGVPSLAGKGSLEPLFPVELSLSGAAPLSTGFLVIGTTQVNLPFLTGILVPAPNLLITGLPTDASGAQTVDVVATIPAAPGDRIVYPAALIGDDGGAPTAAAVELLEFLRTDEARGVFRDHGFAPPPS